MPAKGDRLVDRFARGLPCGRDKTRREQARARWSTSRRQAPSGAAVLRHVSLSELTQASGAGSRGGGPVLELVSLGWEPGGVDNELCHAGGGSET